MKYLSLILSIFSFYILFLPFCTSLEKSYISNQNINFDLVINSIKIQSKNLEFNNNISLSHDSEKNAKKLYKSLRIFINKILYKLNYNSDKTIKVEIYFNPGEQRFFFSNSILENTENPSLLYV